MLKRSLDFDVSGCLKVIELLAAWALYGKAIFACDFAQFAAA
jgi:hypothetical protein